MVLTLSSSSLKLIFNVGPCGGGGDFSESTNLIEHEWYMNNYWMVPCHCLFFCVDRKSKMAITTGQNFSIWPYWENILYLVLNLMPFNNKHGWNVPWEVLNKMCGFFCIDWKSKIAVTAGHRTINMGKWFFFIRY